jgi:4a-hydroxytetrahydrobiopterin dehydratase
MRRGRRGSQQLCGLAGKTMISLARRVNGFGRSGPGKKVVSAPNVPPELHFAAYCSKSMKSLLDSDRIETALKRVPEWEVSGNGIERTFEFDGFSDAIEFVDAVAEIAEEEEHHPDIDIRWNKVKLRLSTHSKGGLTEADFVVAERIDTLAD